MSGETPQDDLAGSAPLSCIERPSWFGSYDGAPGPAQMRAQHVALRAYFLADGDLDEAAPAPPGPAAQPPPSS